MTKRQMIVARVRARAAEARALREEDPADLDPEASLSVRPRDYREGPEHRYVPADDSPPVEVAP